MQLSRRLTQIAQMAGHGNRVCDVGTDHGYVPIWLVKEGIAPSAIAMDVKKGPLLAAKEHIETEGLEELIELRLSDGLEMLKEGEADTVVIAGMGGLLMRRILEKGDAVAKTLKELILQPQSEWKEFRMYLKENGFRIVKEEMLKEDGKFYLIIKACSETDETDYTEEEYRYGKLLLQEKNKCLKEYLTFRLRVESDILAGLEKTGENGRSAERKAEVTEEIDRIRRILNEW